LEGDGIGKTNLYSKFLLSIEVFISNIKENDYIGKRILVSKNWKSVEISVRDKLNTVRKIKFWDSGYCSEESLNENVVI